MEQQIAIGVGSAVVACTSGGPRIASRRSTRILIRPSLHRKIRGGFNTGATGINTSTGANQAKGMVDEKVKALLAEVLRRCDSILEALGGTGDGRGSVVLGVGGDINTVDMGGDTARDSVGASDDDVGNTMLDTGVDVIRASDVTGGILTSTGAVATHQVMHGNILTTTRNSIPSNGGDVVLLRDGGFEWHVGGALGTHTLSTRTPGKGSRGNNLATNDNLNGGFGYDASALGGGSPSGRSSCGLGQEGPGDGSSVPR
ncbi:hypothetical protein GUJ93_ZPchr0006g44501 [Zizania palustris]|uniref:Uncharacterized protein n=1 Tax=Zizania palustris TaxID=103762 RepID=A0A8J5TBZ3_ZIZPA|nr:hypothetical protein GUJ93_ZPchr0006g44501 [Zizania palustris]